MIQNYTEPIVVSVAFLIIFLIFYLYKHENKIILNILSSFYKSKPEKIKKDTRFQDWSILILVLILVFILGIKLITLTVVISDSMKPEFQRGDIIITQSVFKDPEIGDIISFKPSQSQYVITHRIVSIDDTIKTKGDNSPYADKYRTTEDMIISKAIMINNHPVVIKGVGALFITDYSRQGMIFKYGDQFTFMQQLSFTIRTWGYVITIIAIISYIMLIKR